jgi:tetratricopeptide (TPR) repeat protein
MTVGLVMIVKNEEKTLPRLADSLKWQIDHWTILDTGSTDNTMAVARDVFINVPGEVHQAEFEGFGPSRNKAMELAEPHTDWLLSLDADQTLGGTIETVETADWVEIEERAGDLRFWIPRMFRSGRGFHWTGMTHEYLSSPLAGMAARSESFWVVHHTDGGTRGEKFPRDLALLQQEWKDEPNSRTAFYLGRTFQDLGQLAQAVEWYRRRIAMGGWDEEIFYSRYCLGVCLLDMNCPEEAAGHLWRAWGMKHWRAEPLVTLAQHYRITEQWRLAEEVMQLAFRWCRAQPSSEAAIKEGLFIDSTAIEWRCAYEQSISSWYTGNRERGRMLMDYLLLRGDDIPEPFLSSVASNRAFYS